MFRFHHFASKTLRRGSQLPGMVLNFSKPLVVSQRSLITYPRNTGIIGYDKNQQAWDDRMKGKSTPPSWVENCELVGQEEVDLLYKSFPSVVNDAFGLDCTKTMPFANQRQRDMIEHLVPWHPSMPVQLIIADLFYTERRRRNGSPFENAELQRQQARQLAWSLEIITKNMYMVDDILDDNDSRHGIACWHAMPGIGVDVVNDACTLLTRGFLLLKKYFSTEDFYTTLVEFMMETMLMFGCVSVDSKWTLTYPNHKNNPSSKTFEIFVYHKRLQGSLFINIPVIGAMIMHGMSLELRNIAYELGMDVMGFGLMIDDCADCFADIRITNRVGTDIRTGQQTWLFWKAMELGTPEQCQSLMENYGKDQKDCIEAVKKIYTKLNLLEIMNELIEKTGKKLEEKIASLPQEDLPCSIWLSLMRHFQDIHKGAGARI